MVIKCNVKTNFLWFNVFFTATFSVTNEIWSASIDLWPSGVARIP